MNAEKDSEVLSAEKLNRLAKLYNQEDYLFEDVSQYFRRDQTLTPPDFYAIVIWKSNRSKTNIKEGLASIPTTVGELMREVSRAPESEAKVKVLNDVKGIGLAIASAILAVCYPEEFTVLDYRAWGTLKDDWAVKDLPSRKPETAAAYVQYCRACRDFADQMGLTLRDLDRAAWAKSWDDDLKDLTDQ
jgi:hypothetical protein